jgi:beta-barrel assembly-enhancing protease
MPPAGKREPSTSGPRPRTVPLDPPMPAPQREPSTSKPRPKVESSGKGAPSRGNAPKEPDALLASFKDAPIPEWMQEKPPPPPKQSTPLLERAAVRRALPMVGALGAIVLVAALVVRSGGLGGPSASSVYSGAEKVRLAQLWRAHGLPAWGGAVTEPSVVATVERAGGAVARAMKSERAFLVLKEPAIAQAFVLTDDTVVITVGMLRRLKSEAQLAAILAHVIAHDRLGHDDRALDMLTELAPAARAALDGGPPEGAVKLVTAAGTSSHAAAAEHAADARALEALSAAGYDAHALHDAIVNLGVRTGGRRASWLVLHPETAERLAAIKAQASGGRTGDKDYVEKVLDRIGRVIAPDPGVDGADGQQPADTSAPAAAGQPADALAIPPPAEAAPAAETPPADATGAAAPPPAEGLEPSPDAPAVPPEYLLPASKVKPIAKPVRSGKRTKKR